MHHVSVVMSTFNGRRYIIEQLRSIAAQTVLPSEIVICDDGSTDGTVGEIQNFAKRSPVPIRLTLNERRLGYADSFLKAARLATCEYIAFCDQDDIWRSNKIERCISLLTQKGVQFCAHAALVVNESGEPHFVLNQRIKKTEVMPPGSVDPWGVFLGFTQVFHRSLLDIIPERERGPDTEAVDRLLSHDRWVYFIASHFCNIGLINEVLVDYRQHSSNAYGIRRAGVRNKILRKARDAARRLAEESQIASYRIGMLETNRTESRGLEFDLAIARWKSIHAFSELRFRLYSSRILAGRLWLLLRCFWSGAYLPYRYGGLGPKRFLVDCCFGAFGAYLTNCFGPSVGEGNTN